MKFSHLSIIALIFAALSVVSISAQTASGNKIGMIDTQAFLDGTNGIKKYVIAVNTVNDEFKVPAAELDGMGVKMQNLEKEIKTLQAQQPATAATQNTITAKLEEYDKMSREFKFKKEDAETRYNRRSQVILAPIRLDIGNAIQEFAKKNGYVLIFDISKDQTGLFLAWDEKANITKDFITFYNARPTPAVTK